MTVRVSLVFALVVVAVAVAAAPALASLAGEVAAGREVVQRLQPGATSCNKRPRDVHDAPASVATPSLARTGSELVAGGGPR